MSSSRRVIDVADEEDADYTEQNEGGERDMIEEKAAVRPAPVRRARQSHDGDDDDDDDDAPNGQSNVRLTSPTRHSQRSDRVSSSALDAPEELLSQLTSGDALSQSQSGDGAVHRRLLDPEQSQLERRDLSAVLMGITSAVKRSGRGGEGEVDIDHALKLTNTAWQRVAYVKEETLDADALKTITQASLNQIRRLTANKQVDIDGFVRTVRNRFVTDDGEVDWARIGQLIANPIQRQVTIASFMSGPLRAHYVIKERRARQRAEKEDLSEVRAEHLQSTAEEHHSQTDHRVAAMELTLKRLHSVDYFQFILNPLSFGQTIENMFDLTFLIKKGVAQIMERDSDGVPFIRYNEAMSGEGNAESNADSKQYDASDDDDDDDNTNNTGRSHQRSSAKRLHTSSIVAFNYSTWKELCDLYALKDQIIPSRREEKYDDDEEGEAERVDDSDDEKAEDNADSIVADDDDEHEEAPRRSRERDGNRANSADSPAAKRRRTSKSVRTTEKKQRKTRSRRRSDDDDDDDIDDDNADDVSTAPKTEIHSAKRRDSGAMVVNE